MQRLPKILKKEPLLEALFEVRLNGATQIAEILPGFLFHELDPKPRIERLPAADLPQSLREAYSDLQFSLIQRIDWDKYFIAVGDKNVLISCKMPYPKWPNFKKAILDIMQIIAKIGIREEVQRYSIKYVNLIEASTLVEQIKKIKLEINLGDVKVEADRLKFDIHREEGDIVHILSITNSAITKLPNGKEKMGIVVGIDSIRTAQFDDFENFASNLEADLEELRQKNKEKFFGCLTEETINRMGPVYE